MRVEVVSSLVDLEAHVEAWEALLDASWSPMPWQSSAWLRSHRSLPQTGVRWYCLLAYDGDQLSGVMPLLPRRHEFLRLRADTWIVPSQLLQGSPPLLRRGREDEALSRLLEAAARVKPQRPIEMGMLREDDPVLAALRARTSPHRPQLQRLDLGTRYPVRGPAYTPSKRRRRALSNARNRLQRDFEGAFALRTAGPLEHARLLERFLELESAGWKGRQYSTTSLLTPRDTVRFRDRVSAFERVGRVEWLVLEVEGRAVALLLLLRFGRTTVAWETTYDEAFSHYSPGSLLLAYSFEREHELGRSDEVNLMSSISWSALWGVERYYYYRALIPLDGLRSSLEMRALRRLRGAHMSARQAAYAVPVVRSWLGARRRRIFPVQRADVPEGT